MKIQIKVESEGYETALDEYLNEGINYSANTIKNADVDDLQQLASDSFFYGAKFKNDELTAFILDVLTAIDNNTVIEYGGSLHKTIGEFVLKNGIVNSLPL